MRPHAAGRESSDAPCASALTEPNLNAIVHDAADGKLVAITFLYALAASYEKIIASRDAQISKLQRKTGQRGGKSTTAKSKKQRRAPPTETEREAGEDEDAEEEEEEEEED